jgi:hypothetical protein
MGHPQEGAVQGRFGSLARAVRIAPPSNGAAPRTVTTLQGTDAGGDQVFVYFDNDAQGHAPRDAHRLTRLTCDADDDATAFARRR